MQVQEKISQRYDLVPVPRAQRRYHTQPHPSRNDDVNDDDEDENDDDDEEEEEDF